MAHNLDFTTGKAAFAFTGDRSNIWHSLGTAMADFQGVDEWAKGAGLDYSVVKVPAVVNLRGDEWSHLDPSMRMFELEDRFFNCRSDTGRPVSWQLCSDRREDVQPREVLSFAIEYLGADRRFQAEAAGALGGGEKIWVSARFNGDTTVGGGKAESRVLFTTAFDGSASSVIVPVNTMVVCQNTLNIALAEHKAKIVVRHNTKFEPARAARELATLAQGIDRFKAIGDALAQNTFGGIELSKFFKTLLDIPFDETTGLSEGKDVSTRKQNQFADLRSAYATTCGEMEKGTAWTALNAVTRYADHTKSTRKGDDVSDQEAQFTSAQFGSGSAMKGQAMALLMPRIKDRVPVLV